MPSGYGALVRSCRIAAGLTQEELAALAGLGVRTISDVERGRTVPHRSTIDRLARALDSADLAWESVRSRMGTASQPAASQPGTSPQGASPPGTSPPGVAAGPVPRQLPGSARCFTGRDRELAVLSELVDRAGTAGPEMVVAAIGGMAGVGKTALAVHWAHQVAGRFPDGHLYINLRGYGPVRPMSVTEALAGFLRALGLPGQDIPPEADERAARYRTLMVSRRMLILLDNASDADQVRLLLPAGGACVTVVTSRDSLAGLVARDGAVRLELDLLAPTEAARLLEVLIGARAEADPQAVKLLAGLCGRLPLALRVAAELAAARPVASLAELAVELADQRDRLDVLDVSGDAQTAVREVFSWSYRNLDVAAARAFRLVGLHPGTGLDRYAAAALTDRTAVQAGRLLDRLARAYLIQPGPAGRYHMHDLLRGYARELSEAEDSDLERGAAVTRLLDHFLHAAAAAVNVLYPANRHVSPSTAEAAPPVPPVSDPAAARAWLDTHRADLVAAAEHAGHGEWPSRATQLAAIMAHHLDASGYYGEAITMHACASRAARRIGDRTAEAKATATQGLIYSRQGRYAEATSQLLQALKLFQATGDQGGQARTVGNLGQIEIQMGRYAQAARRHRQALALFHALGDQVNEANALTGLAEIDLRQGRYQQARIRFGEALVISHAIGDLGGQARAHGGLGDVDLRQCRYDDASTRFRQAMTLARQIGDRVNEVYALACLGHTDVRAGRYQRATGRLRQALAVFRATGEPVNEAYVLACLGEADLRQGRYPQAVDLFGQAQALLVQTGDLADQARALNGLGDALVASGQPVQARARHATALTLARQIGDKDQMARAHHGLGLVGHAVGDTGQAIGHWQQALVIFRRLGAPEADDVRALLAAAVISEAESNPVAGPAPRGTQAGSSVAALATE